MTDWLIDKSAPVRVGTTPDSATWAGRVDRRLVRISTVTRLEVGFSARTGDELRAGLRQPPLASMPIEYLTLAIEDRAVEVQILLADRSQHRAFSVPDLLIAATTELAGLVLLQLEKDFELIAQITSLGPTRMGTTPAPSSARRVAEAEVVQGLSDRLTRQDVRRVRGMPACFSAAAGTPASRHAG